MRYYVLHSHYLIVGHLGCLTLWLLFSMWDYHPWSCNCFLLIIWHYLTCFWENTFLQWTFLCIWKSNNFQRKHLVLQSFSFQIPYGVCLLYTILVLYFVGEILASSFIFSCIPCVKHIEFNLSACGLLHLCLPLPTLQDDSCLEFLWLEHSLGTRIILRTALEFPKECAKLGMGIFQLEDIDLVSDS